MVDFKQRILKTLALDPQAPAVEYKREWTSWGELGAIVACIDQALTSAGLPQDGAVGCILRNTPEHVGAVLAMFASDRCLVTLNPFYPDATLAEDVRKVRPPAVLASAQDWARPGLKEAVREIGAAGVELTGDPTAPVRLVEDLDLIRGADLFVPEQGVAIYMLTSGTTGPPKRIPLPRRQVLKTLDDATRLERNRNLGDEPTLRSSVIIHNNALVHIAGLWGLINGVMGGFRICLLDKFDVGEWRRAIATHRPKVAALPPTGIRMILESDISKEEVSSLVALRSATAPLDADTIDKVMERWGLPVLTNYGSTEFTGAAAWSLEDFHKLWREKRGAAGKIAPAYDARVVDDATGEVLPPGSEGVLELRGEYVWGGDWVRTTDRAVLDADRFVWIRGRLDNAINRGGFKVHGEDIADALAEHPSVREAAVVGIPDDRLGAVPAAAVILKEGASVTEDELRAFLRARLLPYQVPAAFRIVDDLPRTPSMKPMIPAVQALFANASFQT